MYVNLKIKRKSILSKNNYKLKKMNNNNQKREFVYTSNSNFLLGFYQLVMVCYTIL